MGEYSVSITDLAKQDIRRIASYIRNDLHEPEIAKQMAETIVDTIQTLEDMPLRVKPVNDERLAGKGIRGLGIESYTAFFRVDDRQKTVEIIRVLYSRRGWQTLL